MFSTRSPQALRNLFAGYHEPAGLSRQQSQQMLDGLKASFRKQLDREYGREAGHAAPPGKAGDDKIRHSAATRHLKSILSNPLFSHHGTHNRPAAAATATTAGSSSALATPRRDPADVFDSAVAKGMMTLKAAKGCLLTKKRMLLASPSQTASAQMALRVVRWLKSSGAETDLDFVDDHNFIGDLLPLLAAAEGLEAVAWEWLSRTVNESNPSWDTGTRVRRTVLLLDKMVRLKTHPQHGNLDAAIRTILDAESLFRTSPNPAAFAECLIRPWRRVSWLSTVESFSRSAPSEKLFDAHIKTGRRLPMPFLVETAHLNLHHPTRPDHTPAMRLFFDKDGLQKDVQQRLSKAEDGKAMWRGLGIMTWLSFLGQDTILYLTQAGRPQEADSLTRLLRYELDNFSMSRPAPS